VKEHSNLFPVEKMCSVLKVSVSGYYYWLRAPVGPRAKTAFTLLQKLNPFISKAKAGTVVPE